MIKKAGDIVDSLLLDIFGSGFMETARLNASLFSSWDKIVAEAFSCVDNSGEPHEKPAASLHSGIRELERGVLLVEADHPGWIQILKTKHKEILSAVQHLYPELNVLDVSFRLKRDAPH